MNEGNEIASQKEPNVYEPFYPLENPLFLEASFWESQVSHGNTLLILYK